MKNFTLLLISGLLYSGLSYAQTDQIYTRPNEKTAKAPEKKISQFMKPVNKTTRNNDNSIWRPKQKFASHVIRKTKVTKLHGMKIISFNILMINMEM